MSYYDFQCPYVYQTIENIQQFCQENHVPVTCIEVKSLQQAKELPCVFNNWGVFYQGKFETVNLILDTNKIKRMVL